MSQVSVETHLRFFNIFNVDNLHSEFYKSGSNFGILRVLAASNKWSVSDLAYLFTADEIVRTATLAHYHKTRHVKHAGQLFSLYEEETSSIELNY